MFNLDPLGVIEKEKPKTPVVITDNDAVTNDSDYVRVNLKKLIETASTALESAMTVAEQSESPRAYEVLAQLLNTASELNTKLLVTHQIEKKIKESSVDNIPPSGTINNNTQNIVFSGTSTELIRAMKQAKETL